MLSISSLFGHITKISPIYHTQSSSYKFLVHTHIQTYIPSTSISIIQQHIKQLLTVLNTHYLVIQLVFIISHDPHCIHSILN